MSQFTDFCVKLGNKYKEDYEAICDDEKYNKEKTLDENKDINQYIQAAAEQVFFYKLKRWMVTVNHDVNVNPVNGTDVDLFYDGTPFNLRIEVKTPVLFENTEKYQNDLDAGIIIHGEQDHLYPENIVPREHMMTALNDVTKAFGEIATVKKMDDNKIKDYLVSAQGKMIDSDGVQLMFY